MSSVYATEPATAGRVILETSDGPLEIHLWCREVPQTTRLFLQLCLDGFYNNMIFHRVVNNFLIQTGALRHNASTGAEPTAFSMASKEAASYRQAIRATQALDRRPYEINSRIRFNHRGQVAMALGIKDADDVEDLQPQFFITLEDAPYLNDKHVIFGTISGPTIFNAMRIGRTETDEATNQPVDLTNSTRILSVKIVENPIHEDLVPQPTVPWKNILSSSQQQQQQPKEESKKKKKKRKGKFDTNVLSFGAEFEEEDEGVSAVSSKKKGMLSSHDLVESKLLSKQVDEKVKDVFMDNADGDESSSSADSEKKKKRRTDLKDPTHNNNTEVEKKKEEESTVKFSTRKERTEAKSSGESKDSPGENKQKENGSDSSNAKDGNSSAAAPKPSLVEARRLKYSKGKKSKKEREEETLAKLMAFRSTIQQKVEERKSTSSHENKNEGGVVDDSLAARMARKAQKANGASRNNDTEQAPTYHGQVLESDEEDDNREGQSDGKRAWLATAFKCRKHMDYDAQQDLGGDGRAADDYEVVDTKGRKNPRHHHREKKDKHHRHHDHKSNNQKQHNRDRDRDHYRK